MACVDIYAHACLHTYMQSPTASYSLMIDHIASVHTRTCIHTYIHTYIQESRVSPYYTTCLCRHTHMHDTYIHTHMHDTYTYTHAWYIHTYTHAWYIHTYTHLEIDSLTLLFWHHHMACAHQKTLPQCISTQRYVCMHPCLHVYIESIHVCICIYMNAKTL